MTYVPIYPVFWYVHPAVEYEVPRPPAERPIFFFLFFFKPKLILVLSYRKFMNKLVLKKNTKNDM